MGRFLNPRFAGVVARPHVGGVVRDAKAPGSIPATSVSGSAVGPSVLAPIRTSPVALIGLYAVSIYLISGYTTDLSYRFVSTKPYISMISGVAVLLCFLISGRTFQALRTTVGKLWLAMGIWMCISVLFSRWRGGSFEAMSMFIPKYYLLPFYIAVGTGTDKHCRTIFRAGILGGFILLLVCSLFGDSASGRFTIPSNANWSNPNDLAMQLLLAAGFFMFLVRQSSWTSRITGSVGLLGALLYLLRTGSRGAILAAAVFGAIIVFFSEPRVRWAIGAVAALLVLTLAVATPSGTFGRLFVTFTQPDQTLTGESERAVESQRERLHVLNLSVYYALTNPLFGVGPGRFSDAVWEDGLKKGIHEASLGTHNTYTQIAAECGIPALVFFVGAMVVTIRFSYRLYRATASVPAQSILCATAFACFSITVAIAIDFFFHHVLYSNIPPMVLGLWVATELAARNQGVIPEYGRGPAPPKIATPGKSS